MDQKIVSRLWLGWELLPHAMTVKALGGQQLRRRNPSHESCEYEHFRRTDGVPLVLILESPQMPMVLGSSWLQQHNPSIDWKPSAIMELDFSCQEICLRPPVAELTLKSEDSNSLETATS